MLGLAESCTGGLIGHLLTNAPGASAWFAGGVTAYANSAKIGVLRVAPSIIAVNGAVSEETVAAMAAGARELFGCHCALAVSGIAGPSGATPGKPVGTVWLGCDVPGRRLTRRVFLEGSREEIKALAALAAMAFLAEMVQAL
ncbi:MAG: CinA family protein [Desulfovibrionaceae bacterium]|nr:CinA family protein [Desulfovibrionaceae bacterium]MBF0513599.1 CinA family protein [Desulfovibrionaceae bacterium]